MSIILYILHIPSIWFSSISPWFSPIPIRMTQPRSTRPPRTPTRRCDGKWPWRWRSERNQQIQPENRGYGSYAGSCGDLFLAFFENFR